MISIETEFAIVGGIVNGGAFTLHEVRQTGLCDFHLSPPVALAYRAIGDVVDEHGVVDKPMLRNSLKQLVADYGETRLGMSALNILEQLYLQPWSAVTAKHHAKLVVDRATLYQAKETLNDLLKDVEVWDKGASDFLEMSQSAFTALAIRRTENPKTFGECMGEFRQKFWEQYESGKPYGIPLHFNRLSRMMRGAQPGQLIVVGGPTGGGKTTFIGNIACDFGINRRIPGSIFSFEMSWYSLMERYVFSEARLSSDAYTDHTLTSDEKRMLDAAMDRLDSAPVTIEDNGSMTLREMVTSLRKAKFERDILWAVVDYTQLVNTDQRFENRQIEVTHIIRTLMRLASELKITIFALTQLNEDGDPRESKAIKQDCSIMIVLEPSKDSVGEEVQNFIVRLVKCRPGAMGEVPFVFHASQTRFEEMDDYLESANGTEF